ncbi:MAG: Crp/Fnr family transcriptional regulator [Flavihumibacter sp.]
METLKSHLQAIYPLTEEAWAAMQLIWTPVSHKRKEILTAAGETEKYLYWVLEGMQRGYHLHHDKEATVVFSYAPSFSGILDSFLLQQPSRYYLETLTASRFLRTSYRQLETLRRAHPCIAELMYRSLCQVCAGTLERQIELMVYSAEEKFRTLLKRSPHILQLVPHKYLASYLGIDATTFSKLMGSIKLD